MRTRFQTRLFVLLLSLSSVACHKRGVPPLTLEECDPAGYIGCIQPDAFLSIPISDTNLSLTYSSRWVNRKSTPGLWDTRPLWLGGWSINLVQRYDAVNRILISGDGSWRIVDATKLSSGELAVPSYDGSVAFVFDSAGRHVRTVDGHLGTELLKVTYDSAGRLSEVKGVSEGQPVHVSVRRDLNGAPQALVGIDGGTTTVALAPSANLSAVTNPAGETTEIKWNSAGLVESDTDFGGGVQKFTYDSVGNLTSATDADGITLRYDLKASGDSLEIRRMTPLGRIWIYRAEAVGRGIRRTLIAPDGKKTDQTTDQNGNRTLKVADGTKWAIGFVPNPGWVNAAPILTPIVQTRSDGVVSRRETKDFLRAQPGLPYVQSGSLLTIINGNTWTQSFDPAQRTVDSVDPSGRRTSSSYDESGRLSNFSASGLARISYSYNTEGRIANETKGTGKAARSVRYKYDANTGEIVTTRSDGVIQKIAVDRAGRTVAVSAADGSTTLGGYDAAGRVNQIQPAGGLKFTTGMSAAGRSTAFAPPPVHGDASIEVSFYDQDGQLSTINGLGSRAITYEHDSAARVTTAEFDQGTRKFAYDGRTGLMSQASDPSGVSVSYGYAGSTLTRLAWSGPVTGSVSVALDADGRVSRESVSNGSDLIVSYDSAGLLTCVGPLSLQRDAESGLVTHTVLGVVETHQQFDGDGLLIRSTTVAGGKLILDLRYMRDALGRIKSVSETDTNRKTLIIDYSYDRADRLASVRRNGHPVEADTYDAAGNRLSTKLAGGTLKASYDDRDRLLDLGTAQYEWMPDGSLAGVAHEGRATAFVYDDFGALRQASLPDGRKITYLVDADGRRIGREIGGKLVAGYLYSLDGTIAAETDSPGKIVSRFGYDAADHLAIIERGGVSYRVITDQVGSPRMIIDSRTGIAADEIAYDAWGNVIHETVPGFIPIGFAGGLHDPDTGFICFGARDYDPQTGRWTAADPIRFDGGDANLYLYAAADPVNFTDASGLNSSAPLITLTAVINRGPGTGTSRSTTVTPAGNGLVQISSSWSNSGGSNTTTATPLGNGMIQLTNNWNTQRNPQQNGNPPQNGSPPQSGNPPQNGGPPQNGTPPWSCWGGICPGPNPGPGGCLFGNCNIGPNGFSCIGIYCENPNNQSCWMCSMGEPHERSLVGLHFDFQAVGEFLVATSSDGKYTIQARQQPFLQGTAVTINTAVAANVNGDRISVYVNEPSFLLLNEKSVKPLDISEPLPHGGLLQRHGGVVLIRWPGDGGVLSVIRTPDSLNYSFQPGSNANFNFTGLLGNGSGAPDKIAAKDGGLLRYSDPEFIEKLYTQVGESWRLKQSESLFHYWPGESTAKFTDLNFPPKYVSLNSLSSAERYKAESICRAVGIRGEPLLDDCILDVGVTRMPAFAAASVGVRLPTATVSAVSASNQPAAAPSSTNHFSIKIGDTVSPDQPMTGAGTIKDVGQKQFYSFQGRAGEVIFVGQGPCEGAQPNFDLLKPDNALLANVIGNCNADIGRRTLPLTGTYTIVTSTDKPNVNSRYKFFVHAVPPDQHFSVRLLRTVSPESPTRGAGHISAPGEQQFYDFSASAGATVHIEGKCTVPCPKLAIRATARGDDSARFFDLNYLKNDWKLPPGGKYTIQVRSNGYVGEYGFTALINGH
jgi:RHS repeat-associated protein